MELFIDEYLKFFEIRNEHNSDKSFGKYKRTKTDRVFDEFMSGLDKNLDNKKADAPSEADEDSDEDDSSES